MLSRFFFLTFLIAFLGGVADLRSQYIEPDPCLNPNAIRWSTDPTLSTLTDGDYVHIAANTTVYLDTSTPDLDGIYVEGDLVFTECGPAAPELFSTWILVTGTMQIGTPQTPIFNKAKVTLIDWFDGSSIYDDTNNDPPAGFDNYRDELEDRGLVIVGPGQLITYGKNRGVNWTRLSADADKDATSVTLDPNYQGDWDTNDRIVIASTDFDWQQSERRKLSSATGNVLLFNNPLEFDHYGRVYQVPNQTGWEISEQAEVGLLSHSVIIQAEQDQHANQDYKNHFGHIFVVKDEILYSGSIPVVELNWTEFRDLGVEGKASRYAMHLHRVGILTSQSQIKFCSFHRCYNHWVVLHDTQEITLEGNVAYETTSHGYYLQGEVTKDIILKDNLGLATRIPDINNFPNPPNDHLLTPGVFYWENAENTFENNAAGGSSHYGFWMDFQAVSPKPEIWPGDFTFTGNVSHSNGEIGFYQDERPIFQLSANDPLLSNFTAYKNRRYGVWNRGYGRFDLDDIKVADCRGGFYLASDGYLQTLDTPLYQGDYPRSHAVLKNSLVIGETDNLGIGQHNYQEDLIDGYPNRDRPEHETQVEVNGINTPRSLAQKDPFLVENGATHEMKWDVLTGFELYDGLLELDNVKFAGFEDALFKTGSTAEEDYRRSGALTQVGYDSAFAEDPRNFCNNIALDSTVDHPVFFRHPSMEKKENMILHTILYDEDGSLTGTSGNVYVVPDNNLTAATNFLTYPVAANATHAAPEQAFVISTNDVEYAQVVLVGWEMPPGVDEPNWLGVEYGLPGSLSGVNEGVHVAPFTPPVYPFNAVVNQEYTFSYPEPAYTSSTTWPTKLSVVFRFCVNVGRTIKVAIPLHEEPLFGEVQFNQTPWAKSAQLPDLDLVDYGWWYDSVSKHIYIKMTSELNDTANGQQLNWEGTEDICEIEIN